MSTGELAANAFVAAAIFLAGRNNIHTWWTGIVGCVVFAVVFFGARLYADVTLQVFFIVTSVYGWWKWLHGGEGGTLPVRFSSRRLLIASAAAATAVALGYGWLLLRFTNAYAPFLDSIILAFSRDTSP